jgi:hypothetical protein
MKLRIKGDSIRLRLSKTDVANLCREGVVEEETHFPHTLFKYRLEPSADEKHSATFSNNLLTVRIPASFISGWMDNEVVGTEGWCKTEGSADLRILVEKDFKCLDATHESQEDNYENPNKTC